MSGERSDGERRQASLRRALGATRGGRAACAAAALVAGTACGDQAELGGDDQDGIAGGDYAFVVTASDTAFAPSILKTQNLADVKVTLTNAGTTPHGFAIACLGTACFPETATIAPVAPGESATTTFQTPWTEGIYEISSSVPGDTLAGQFIIQ